MISIGAIIAQPNDPFEDYRNHLDQMDYSNIQSGFLLNRGFTGQWYIQSLTNFNLFVDDNTGNQFAKTGSMTGLYWDIYYDALLKSDVRATKDFMTADQIDATIDGYNNDEIPFVVFDVEGTFITQELIDDYITNSSPTIVQDETNTFTYNIFGSITDEQVSLDRDVTFSFKKELHFSNRNDEPTAIHIDFGDGNGFYRYDYVDQTFQVSYPTRGEKVINFYVEYDYGGLMLENSFKFTIYRDLHEVDPKTDTVLPPIVFDGGVAYPYLSGDKLDKPIIVQHGWDLTDDIDKDSRGKKYGQYFNTILKPKGFDLVLIVLDEPNRGLDLNIDSLKDAIKEINAEKNITSTEESILIGESMGGLLARGALKELENEGIDHEVGLYMSFDAPHKGANVPIGFQQMVDDILNLRLVYNGLPVLVPLINQVIEGLNSNFYTRFSNNALETAVEKIPAVKASMHSDASKDMLVRHNDMDGAARFINNYSYFESIGYPEGTRNISLINGSYNGQSRLKFDGTPLLLTDELFYKKEETELIYLEASLPVSPINTTTTVSSLRLVSKLDDIPVVQPTGQLSCRSFSVCHKWVLKKLGEDVCMRMVCVPEFELVYTDLEYDLYNESDRVYTFDDKPYDIAPGAYPGSERVNEDLVKEHVNSYFCFIPTVSALDLDQNYMDNNGGLFAIKSKSDINYCVEQGITPFEEVYSTDRNTLHVSYKDEEIDGLFLDIIENEFEALYTNIQNRTITNTRSFIANDNIKIGRDVNEVEGKHMGKGPVVVESGVNAHFESEKGILVKDGTLFKSGSAVCLKIDPQNPVFNRPPSADPSFYVYALINGGDSWCFESEPSFSIGSVDTNVSGYIDYDWVLDNDMTYQGNSIDITEELNIGMHNLVVTASYQGLQIAEFSKVFEIKLGADCDYGSGTSNRKAKAVEKSELENLSIGPNPFNEFIEIELPNEVFKKTSAMKLELFDSLGRLVKNLSIVDLEAKNVKINIGTTVSPGAYFLRITTSSGGIIVKKLMHE